jgi:dethiobiotin synthetase
VTALFITATGTDIGKTFVGVGLIEELLRRGRKVAALKPVVSGYDDWSAPVSDPARLLVALELPVTAEEIARISPWRFRAPLSPDMAAKREGKSIDFDELLAFTEGAIATREEVLLIEGIGGVMVPLDESRTVLDWMAVLGLPVLLVGGSYLGTISHTLSAFESLRMRGLETMAIIISETDGSSVPLAETVKTIARFTDPVPVLAVPRLVPPARHTVFRLIADLL